MATPLEGHMRVAPPRRILLLALLPIGDTLFITPTLRALRTRYPEARLVALAYASNAPLLRGLPALDEVLVLPAWRRGQGGPALVGLLARLRRVRFDACVDFTSPFFKWIPLLASIPRRTYMKFDRGWWLVPGRHRRWRATHATEHYYNCARELGPPPWGAVDHTPSVALPPEARRAADAFLSAHGDRAGGPLVALHPGGSGLDGRKRWPAERFAALGDALTEAWGARVLVLGGPDEVDLAHTVARTMRTRAVVANGELSLLASFAVIARCDLFIGNDSSPLHAAAALGTPYVGIYGPTCLANFQPLPRRPGQGRLVAAWPPAAPTTYFVGGQSIWARRGSRAAAGLRDIAVDAVQAQARALLQNAWQFGPNTSERWPLAGSTTSHQL